MPTVLLFVAPHPKGGGERIFLKTPYGLKDICSSLTGREWEPPLKAWHVPATPTAAGEIMRKFKFHNLTGDEAWDELSARAVNGHDAALLKTAVDLPDTPTRTSAWLHQRRAFAFAKEHDASMLAMDMGTGKSLVTIAYAQHFDVRKMLILAPVSVVGVWPKQFQTHALDPDEWVVGASMKRMPVRARAELLAKAIVTAQRTKRRAVCVINYEASWRPDIKALLESQEWDLVVCDESHRVKSAGGNASMQASAMRKRSRRRLADTGTPMPHSPADIYAQYRFLDPSVFGTSKNRFMNRYAIMKQIKENVSVVDGWQNMDEFNAKFASLAFVVSKEEALPDLPEKIHIDRTFELGPKALRVYRQLADEFVADTDAGLIVASNALTRVMRFRQVTSGHAKTIEGDVTYLDDGREKLLMDVLDDIGRDEPVVVFAAFHEDLNAIERCAVKYNLNYGELSGRRRDGLTADSTMNPEVDVLGCQLKSGGVGIDLTRACYGVYYSIGYELGDIMQSEDRLHRPGQTRPVRYIHLLAENAEIDWIMRTSLINRKSIVDSVVEAAKAHQL